MEERGSENEDTIEIMSSRDISWGRVWQVHQGEVKCRGGHGGEDSIDATSGIP